MAGGVTAHWILIPALKLPESPIRSWLEEAAWRLGLLGGSFLPIALSLVFIRQLIEFRDPFVPWTEDAQLLLTGTKWGRTWVLGVTGSFLLAAAFVFGGRGRRLAWAVSAFVLLGLSSFPAFTGHASGTEGLRPLTILWTPFTFGRSEFGSEAWALSSTQIVVGCPVEEKLQRVSFPSWYRGFHLSPWQVWE